VCQGCGGLRLALPSRPGNKGGEQAQCRGQAQGGGNNNDNNNKKAGGNQPLAGAPIVAAAAPGGRRGGPKGDKHPRQPSNSDDNSMKCPVHNSTRHSASVCREIKKLGEQFHEKIQQQRQDGAPSRQWEGKQRMDPQEEKDVDMEIQDAKRALRAVFGHSDSESNDNERRKMLHVMFRGSWAIMSRSIIKTLRREIVAVAPTLKTAPHRKWVETPIGFDTSDCPKSMVGAG
jgi:hypothetical protein